MLLSAKINIESKRLSIDEVKRLLLQGDKDFNNTLLSSIDAEAYSQKLSKNALFTIASIDASIVGCIAYYLNESDKFIYISHFWVDSSYQNMGIGSKILTFTEAKSNQHKTLLEVVKSNDRAYSFYSHRGFHIKENRGDKYLMEKVNND